jgi:hypothetical protein
VLANLVGDLLSSKATNSVARSAATAGRALDEISIGGLLDRMLDTEPYRSSAVRRLIGSFLKRICALFDAKPRKDLENVYCPGDEL